MDVLVIGGGMAGLVAAVKAHDAGAKVMLVSKGRLGASGQTPFAKGIFDSPLYHNSFSKPIEQRNIRVLERIVVTDLIKEKGCIAGAAGFSLDEEKVHIYRAKSVILCTGAGGFKPNGFPICDLTHDGTVMAYNIGAKVTGKEWNDGHPGQAVNAAACFDGWHGMFERKPGTTGVEVHHDLGMELNYLAYTSGGPLQGGPSGMDSKSLDVSGSYVPAEFVRSGPPGWDCTLLVTLWDHISGAIYTQVRSSLAGSAVQGAIAAEAAAEYCKKNELVTIPG